MKETNTKHIYLVRHGESRSNATRIIEGAESPLTEKGIKQAAELARRFENINVDLLLSSPYIRALDTAKAIAQAKGDLTIEVVPEVRERVYPSAVVGTRHDDSARKEFVNAMESGWLTGNHSTDGESFEQLSDRARTVKEILEQKEERNIVVSGHGVFSKFLSLFLLLEDDLTPELFVKRFNPRMRTANAAITYFTLDVDEGWQMRAWNDHAHLG
mgnify:CR=1 FL=1